MLRHFYKNIMPALLIASTGLGGCSLEQMMQPVAAGSDEVQVIPAAVPAGVQREYGKAMSAFHAGEAAQAEAVLQAFVEKHPQYTNAWVNLAILYNRRGDSSGAVHLLQHAVKNDPDNVYALNRLGVMHREQGDFSAAEQMWLQATRVQPDYAYAWYNLGVLYDLYLQDMGAAVTYYQRYQSLTEISDSPDSSDPAVQRWIADLQRRMDDAPTTANATETL